MMVEESPNTSPHGNICTNPVGFQGLSQKVGHKVTMYNIQNAHYNNLIELNIPAVCASLQPILIVTYSKFLSGSTSSRTHHESQPITNQTIKQLNKNQSVSQSATQSVNHSCIHTQAYILTYMYTYMLTGKQKYMHTYIHTYIHIAK